MLAVIGIIAALAVVGLMATRGSTKGASVKGAVSVASSLTLTARSEAQTLGGGARLVIDADFDSSSRENYLRRIAVLQAVDDDGDGNFDNDNDGNPDAWKLNDKPTVLPKGAYFSEEFSAGYDTMQFDFNTIDSQDGATGNDVFYYEFDGNGRLIDGPTSPAQVVFVSGILDASGTLLDPDNIDESGERFISRDGFIIRKAGRLTYFDSMEQIQAPAQP